MMGMLAATVTRSLLAALFVPLVLGVAQFFSPQMLMPMGIMPDAWLAILIAGSIGNESVAAFHINGKLGDAKRYSKDMLRRLVHDRGLDIR